MTLLEATNISHSFDYPLFDDVNIKLHAKESIAVVGVSGSGKSTLLHILSTLLAPKKGSVKLFGQEIYTKNTQKQLLHIRRYKIGIVFQSHYLFKGFSAKENIEVSSLLVNHPIDEEIIKAFGIERVLEKRVTELSGGEQQRVSIARVLTKRPKILFADEPTGNLDKKTAGAVMDVLFHYVQDNDAALFLVTHDLQLAQRCSKVYRLEDLRLKSLQ
ncbi:putative ABC transport system ATP-binding protein [Nitratiruptor sp. YY08-26]|uniref:ABC transporter ATP-binding protein n=1 Tax=unclassified Nitratiruptor TaxID=2624044 RepID=UPI00191694B6|nr:MULTISPECIES: ABC transporter ATP-binding protein [unclassified Nitratiruptor]BCD62818.1 putative ABC transport system ATP-binding protein [Nitratiruptor sp. YY08-13]BCD66754.1 putative ABC transport system ATP-binding protein [Nitratiruptor sp. YY08-26]